MRFQLFAARAALALLILALGAALVAIAAVRLDRIAYTLGWEVMAVATVLGLAALALAAAWLVSAIRRNDGLGKRPGLVALVGAALFVYPPLSTVYYGLTMPPIHDATTDPGDPPGFVALARLRRPDMNPLAFDGGATIRYQGEDVTVAYALHTYKNGLITKPLNRIFLDNPRRVSTMFWRCFNAAKDLGWTIVDFSEKDRRIEATAASFWFGQVSDVVIRVRPAGPLWVRVDARAESRRGRTDNGFNIGLLKALREKL